tara:strand:- start:303 stop:530 length:228 start_codon:yes stop_codon:yes gene_type:complete
MTKYPKVRNGKFESGFHLPHIIDEENKVVWIRITSAITAMGMSAFKRQYFPNYECKIPNKETWERLKEKFDYKGK